LYFWLHTFKPNINKYLAIFTNFLPHFWLLQTSKITSFSLNFEFLFLSKFHKFKKSYNSFSLLLNHHHHHQLLINPHHLTFMNHHHQLLLLTNPCHLILVLIIIFCSLSSSSHQHPQHLIIVPTNVLVQHFLFQFCDVAQETNFHKHI
jgi:hypothetical protein